MALESLWRGDLIGRRRVTVERSASPLEYDALAYDGPPDPLMHPNRIAAVAWLMGVDCPAPDRARVLDIGCATGNHLIPMAYQFPAASFVGIDYSASQIARARSMAEALPLPNLRLEVRDLRNHADLGQFDIIIAHGVYSWVPAEVRRALLELCRQHLSPTGVAAIDYNVYPGWRIKQVFRDLAGFHARSNPDLAAATQQSTQLLDFVAENLFAPDSAYGQAIRQMQRGIGQQQLHYLAHEYGAAVNEPCLYADFVAEARGTGMQVAGDVQFAQAMPPHMAGKVEPMLDQFAGEDPVQREQYLDFLRGREFRRTLLTLEGSAMAAQPLAGALQRLHFSTGATAEPSGAHTVYRCPDGTGLRTNDPGVCRVMDGLCAAAPTAMSFAAAAGLMRGSAGSPEKTGEMLLSLVQTGLVRIHASPPRVAGVTERPRANGVARLEAALGRSSVTSMHHQAWGIDAALRGVIPLLDGTRNRAGILAESAGGELSELALGRMLTWLGQAGILDG